MAISLTSHQQTVFTQLQQFVRSDEQQVFILRGYAGTGKTTLVGFLLDWMEKEEKEIDPILLASTGRAARILQSKTKRPSSTVHRHIYSFDVLDEKERPSKQKKSPKSQNGQLVLSFALKSNDHATGARLYIIDEASMLSFQKKEAGAMLRFGSGNVLGDFLAFAGKHKVIFVGDPAQLPPPVGINPFSAALQPKYLSRTFEKKVVVGSLTEIMRQKKGGAILQLSGIIREQIKTKRFDPWEELMRQPGPTLYHPYSQKLLFDRYIPLIQEDVQKPIIITHSNKQAFFLNQNIRQRLGQQKRFHLYEGSLLMVSQNSYDVGLSNGDQVILEKARLLEKRAGFTFLEVRLRGVHDDQIYKTYMLKEFLFTPAANLPPQDSQRLLIDFDRRMRKKGLKRNSDEYKEMMLSDRYLNALRAKFGYAITCHKSQGGEWPHVFLNLSDTLDRMDGETRLRWLYTAVTRAQDKLDIKMVYRGNTPKKKRK